MKNLILFIGLTILSTNAFAESTEEKIIERIQIQGNASDNNTYYYFYNSTGWKSPSCPNALYAYISESDKGAKAILSLAMSSKITKTKVKFSGRCRQDNNQYFRLDYMYQM